MRVATCSIPACFVPQKRRSRRGRGQWGRKPHGVRERPTYCRVRTLAVVLARPRRGTPAPVYMRVPGRKKHTLRVDGGCVHSGLPDFLKLTLITRVRRGHFASILSRQLTKNCVARSNWSTCRRSLIPCMRDWSSSELINGPKRNTLSVSGL